MAKHIYTGNRRELSTKLIEARETANLTQKQVADSGVLSQSELSKIENGQRKVEFLTLLELAELYDKDVAFFVPVKFEE
jgi:transcriptional regulator with XRE-family HTH domain